MKRTKKSAKKVAEKTNEVRATDISLDAFAAQSLKIYGSYVVEDRAVPEFRDGLKPVHRAGLWAAHKLNLRHNAKFRKAAKVFGDVIGSYHPHGDQSAYGAIVGLANGKPNLIRGEGNWGSPIDNAAAMRYTECRLSSFSDLFLLDTEYLKVVPTMPNFDGTTTMPLHLPALLPNILLMGNPTAPAYGVRAGNPPFGMDGVVKIVRSMLRGKKPTVKMLNKYLEVDFPYGCQDASDEEQWSELLSNGKGSLSFVPDMEAVWDHKDKKQAKKILITSFAPGFRGASITKQLDKIANLSDVSKAYPRVSKKDKRAGPYGCLYVIEPSRGISEDDFFDLAEKIQTLLTSKESYDLGCTVKSPEGTVKFVRPNFIQFFNTWMKYRIGLETKMIKYLIQDTQEKIEHQEMLLFAVDNRDMLLKLLPKVLKTKNPDEALAKAIKKPIEFAKKILDLQIRRLAALERAGIVGKIKELKVVLKALKKDLKNPNPRIDKDLVERVKSYKTKHPKYDVRK